MKKTLIIFLVGVFIFLTGVIVWADELQDVERDLNTLNEQYKNQLVSAGKLNQQLNQIKQRVSYLEKEIVSKAIEVKKGEEALVYQKGLLDERTKSYYKNINKNTLTLINFFIAENLSESLQNFFYQKSLVDDDKNTIIKIVMYIRNLEEKKKQLEDENTKLEAIKVEVDRQSKILAGEISQTQQKIAELSARQQQLIAQKLASLNISRSAASLGRCDSDLTNDRDPGFSPKFALFTYGAPHRKGLNQYGALGRAKDGQNEEQILQEYYPGMSLKKDYDKNITISTTTGWSGTIEEYVKRIYEVPDSWIDNNLAVLKAQAVAARTYALRVTENGAKQICTTEQCQVFKNEPKGGNWEQAVNSTAGWVLMDGGSPGFTQYASTHGGYIINLEKFDGKNGTPGNFNELNERAYDRDSPWFYCDWGSRSEYNKTAWLRPTELADIVNVILLARKNSSSTEHLYQADKPHPYGGETWNAERVKNELGAGAYNNIDNMSVGVDFGSGKTTSITVSGDGKSDTFNGDEFKNWFNLRAPANIQIVGPLYNAEKR